MLRSRFPPPCPRLLEHLEASLRVPLHCSQVECDVSARLSAVWKTREEGSVCFSSCEMSESLLPAKKPRGKKNAPPARRRRRRQLWLNF